jgi:hypothetical protein
MSKLVIRIKDLNDSNDVLRVPVARELDAIMVGASLRAEVAANDNACEAIREHRGEGYVHKKTERTEDELVLFFAKGAR